MTINEANRRGLWQSLCDAIGETHADTLMTMLPAQPLPDLATRDDLHALASELRGEMTELRFELRGEMAELRAELRGEMADLRGELKADFARQTTIIVMSLASLIIAVMGVILTLGFTGAFA